MSATAPETSFCKNWYSPSPLTFSERQIEASKMRLHEVYCLRFLKRCPFGCEEMLHKDEIEEHEQEFHQTVLALNFDSDRSNARTAGWWQINF